MNLRLLVLLLWIFPMGSWAALHPLEPLDVSSPQATMKSFFALADEVGARYFEYRDSPNQATLAALEQTLNRIKDLLDLSQVPPAARYQVAEETFLMLWDIMARLELPDLGEIPDESAVGKDGEEPLKHWRVPRSEITISRIEEGPRTGDYLFSAATVADARQFYELGHGLPLQRDMPIENVVRIGQLFTGWMIPQKWVERLPDWTNTLVLGQVLWKWFAFVLIFGLAIGAVIAVFTWARRRPSDSSLRSHLRRLSTPLTILVLAPLVQYLSRFQIGSTGSAAVVPDYLIRFGYIAAAIWIVWLISDWIASAIISSPRIHAQSVDAHLIRLSVRSAGIVVIVVLIFRFAYDLGLPVYGLIAGAGVGGLAVALAARSTLENFLGTLNLYADRPVRVGEFCRYGEDPSAGWLRIGTVEEIGLRSTRIRGVDRTVTTIPNADFANMHIVNLTRRDRMLFKKTIRLRLDTTLDQLRLVRAALRELLLAHPRVTNDPARVRVSGFGAYSLDVDLFAYVNTADWNEFLAIQEDLVLRIMNIVSDAGTALALPSRTVYQTRDDALDRDRQQIAERQLCEWSEAGTLPFPDFPGDYREQITDTLDYPPRGSPDYEPETDRTHSTPDAASAGRKPEEPRG